MPEVKRFANIHPVYFFKAWPHRHRKHQQEYRLHAWITPTSTNPISSGDGRVFATLRDAETDDVLWCGIHPSHDAIIAICNAAREYGLEITSDIKRVN